MDLKPQQQKVDIKPEERVKEDKKKRVPKTCPNKVSSFFITINTNFYVSDKTESEVNEYREKFTKALETILPTFDTFVEFKTSKMGIKFGYSLDDPLPVLLKRIVENKLQYVLEVSPNTKRLHAHILFYMKKKGVDTKVKIGDIKNYFINNGFEGAYVNYKLVTTLCTIEEYMRKNPID